MWRRGCAQYSTIPHTHLQGVVVPAHGLIIAVHEVDDMLDDGVPIRGKRGFQELGLCKPYAPCDGSDVTVCMLITLLHPPPPSHTVCTAHLPYRAYCGASLIMPKSRYTRSPLVVARRLPVGRQRGIGFRIQGSGSRVRSGSRVHDTGFRIQGSGSRVIMRVAGEVTGHPLQDAGTWGATAGRRHEVPPARAQAPSYPIQAPTLPTLFTPGCGSAWK